MLVFYGDFRFCLFIWFQDRHRHKIVLIYLTVGFNASFQTVKKMLDTSMLANINAKLVNYFRLKRNNYAKSTFEVF